MAESLYIFRVWGLAVCIPTRQRLYNTELFVGISVQDIAFCTNVYTHARATKYIFENIANM